MVNYLASSAQTTILITVKEVSTSLTVSAPASAEQGAFFMVSGILTRDDTGVPIPNAVIDLRYNGSPLGSAVTGVDGDYLASVKIDASGSFTITANFAGMEVVGLTLLPSSAVGRISTEIGSLLPILVLIASAYLLSKK